MWDDDSTDTLLSVPGGSPRDASSGDVAFGPFNDARSFRLYLQDVSCNRTYFSDGTSTGGTSADHVTIAKHWQVSFADAGFVGDSCRPSVRATSMRA